MAAPQAEPGVLVTIDRGNSTLDCMEHASGRRARFSATSTHYEEVASFLRAGTPTLCVASSVVSGGLDSVESVLSELGIPWKVAGRDIPCPLTIDYKTPATLGADRWLGALAAHRLHGCAVVVDCGTATTVNLVEADGTFRGGAIAPGLSAIVAGMAAVTPALPRPDLETSAIFPPRSSQEAVEAGVLAGYSGLVERLVCSMVRVARGAPTLVITGGNASRLLGVTRLRPVQHDDLVHQGLRMLVEA